MLLDSWPGQMRTVYGDHQRFVDTYFKQFPGMYFTGDGARRDEDGYYWITGRVDDVINVVGPPARHGRDRERARRATRRWPRPPSSASRTTSRAKASTRT